MSNLFAKVLAYILIICGLTSCATTPMPTSTHIPAPINPATWTPRPTITPFPPPTRRPTFTPTVQPTRDEPNPTIVNSISETPYISCEYSTGNMISPKKDWTICGNGSKFKVVNKNGALWNFSAQDQFGVEYYGNFTYLHWTVDEKFLYFAVMNPLDGVGPITVNAEALFRMDLLNGVVTTVLGSIADDAIGRDFYIVSIAPTSRRLVYAHGSPKDKIHLLDLQNGDEKIIPIEPAYTIIGDFVWSDDGLQLAYKLYAEGEELCKYSYSIRLLNLTDFSAITFVKNIFIDQCVDNSPEFDIMDVSSDHVTLQNNEGMWQYNIESQRLVLKATITPLP